jgi:hypothetical protein
MAGHIQWLVHLVSGSSGLKGRAGERRWQKQKDDE